MVENKKNLGAQDAATLQLLEENITNAFQDSDVKIFILLSKPDLLRFTAVLHPA